MLAVVIFGVAFQYWGAAPDSLVMRACSRAGLPCELVSNSTNAATGEPYIVKGAYGSVAALERWTPEYLLASFRNGSASFPAVVTRRAFVRGTDAFMAGLDPLTRVEEDGAAWLFGGAAHKESATAVIGLVDLTPFPSLLADLGPLLSDVRSAQANDP